MEVGKLMGNRNVKPGGFFFRGLNDSNVLKEVSVKKELTGLQAENFSRDHLKILNASSSTGRL
jgi:hypothetical protein